MGEGVPTEGIKTTLDELTTGDIARVVAIRNDVSMSLKRRLLDMGITKGTVLRVERHAPLGDPVQIFIKGYHLAIRLNEARAIEVELLPQHLQFRHRHHHGQPHVE